MTEATKNSIISAITSVLMLLGSIPVFAKILPPDVVASLNSQVPGVVSAVGTVLLFGSFIYKLIPKSAASIAKGAIEQPDIKQIEVTPKLAAQVQHPDVVAR